MFSWLFVPFCAVFNPLEVLPKFMQIAGKALPMTYVFEAIRSKIMTGYFPVSNLIISYSLNIAYLGDGHYDVLSACQKSIRGSDVNASLHYLARLIEAGDFDSIYRRMSVCAYEDIGLANPGMGPKVMACINTCERVGMPELVILLSVVVIELALSPKSNSAKSAIFSAMEDIEKGNIGTVPKHINSTAFGYKYPHDYPNGYVEQQYLPDELINRKYYSPKITSKYEKLLKEIYEKMNK
jgi:putative ATPase